MGEKKGCWNIEGGVKVIISSAAECGPWMLVPAGLGAFGALLMGWGSVRGESWNVKTGAILAGAFCIFTGFALSAYTDIERCYGTWGVASFWLGIVLLPLLVVFSRVWGGMRVRHVSLAVAIFFGGPGYWDDNLPANNEVLLNPLVLSCRLLS